MKKLNGYLKTAGITIAVLTILYNTVATHIIFKNDVKHLQEDFVEFRQEMKEDIKDIYNYLLSQ